MRVKKFIWLITVVSTGVNSPLSAAESTDDNGETMVVESTAEQVLKQQPGVSIITVTIFKRILPLTILPILFVRCLGLILPAIAPRGRAEITDKLIFVVWGRKIP